MPRLRVLFTVPLVAALAGCYGPAEPGVAVSGRVTYQGKPVHGAGIFFVPDFDKEGRGGQGMVTNGRYSIVPPDGPYPGEFNVIFMDPRRDDPNFRPDSASPLIPLHYRYFNGLRVTVPARKSYSFDFDLK